MKRLKNKVFFVLLSILTIFLVSILMIFNYQDYYQTKENIKQNLIKAERMNNNKNFDRIPKPNIDGKFEFEDNSLMFIDSIIYTVLLNQNNEIVGIINNSDNNITTDEIVSLVSSYIDKKNNKIGNIYFQKYVYSFKSGKFLIIMDISNINKNLMNNLELSLIIFLLLESLIIFISNILTAWIIKPVIENFEKQKQFIADASHELKTPLSVIIASSEALENDKNETKWLNNIKEESNRMNNLIKNLLDLAKLDNINSKEKFKDENISKIIELSSLTYESLMYEQNIKLETNIENNINLNCSCDQIKELMSILIDNAIKHSDKKGKIIINLYKNKNNIVLEVKNKGKSIPKGDEEKIFERFYRADESRNRSEGRYGLGLAIAKGIVNNHNGEIVASSNNGYTTLKVEFKKN